MIDCQYPNLLTPPHTLMDIFHDPQALQRHALAQHREQRPALTIGLVPTMGALHEGHLTLLREARSAVGLLVASIFVNPTQFGPNEDLAAYPRDFDGDRDRCAAEGVDVLFFPTVDTMYPSGFQTRVQVEGWNSRLCGAGRPTHFDGVTTVVLKLFNIVQPDVAFFGWKDAQQFIILRKMVQDLNVPVQMQGIETVREPDGLAMSSRNAYLSARERAQAPVLRRALVAARERALSAPETPASELERDIRDRIGAESDGQVEYVEIVSTADLAPAETFGPGVMIALAARFGRARLIDNIRID